MTIKKRRQNMVMGVIALVTVSLFSGCVKYYETLPSEFPQGGEKGDYRAISANYVKSARVYDQFLTRAFFDALWLSDEVRVAYAKLYCAKRGKSSEDTEAFIVRQREENKHWTTFYVLADVRDRDGTSLSDREKAPWTFYLKIGDYKVEAVSVKEIELEPEFRAFFDQQFNSFKTAYAVKFPAREKFDGEADKKIDKKKEPIQLMIESVYKSVKLSWSPWDKKKEVLRNEDFYWG